MIMFFLRGRTDDLNSTVDDLSCQIEHMVPRSELELEKHRVAKWKRRAHERRICANRYNKNVCALEHKLESSHRRYRNLSLVRSLHSVSMENQRLRAKIDALKALLVL
nr:hypothetical protein [Tanacetum cinerariifolium]